MTAPCPAKQQRPWPVTALAALLLVQALGFAALAFILWRLEIPGWAFHVPGTGLTLATARTLGVLAAVLALLALLTAAGFLCVRPAAWVYAVLIQGTTLAVALILRFSPGLDFSHRSLPSYLLYLVMFYAICMVVYLNYSAVHDAFAAQQARRASRENG